MTIREAEIIRVEAVRKIFAHYREQQRALEGDRDADIARAWEWFTDRQYQKNQGGVPGPRLQLIRWRGEP